MKSLNKIKLYVTLATYAFFMATCTPSGESGEHGHDEHGHEDDHGHDHDDHNENEVHLNADQMKLMGVKYANPENLSLKDVVQSSGQLTAPPGKRAIVGSITDGRISEILIMQGDKVHKGQVLARIEHPDIVEMQEQYLVSLSRLNFIRSQYKRNKTLLENQAISEVEFQETESNLRAEEAVYNAFRTKFKLLNLNPQRIEEGHFYSHVPVLSPIDGNIHQIMVQLGTYVNAEMPLFNIVDIHHIHMDLAVFEKDIHKVHKGDLVAFTLVDQPDMLYKGHIFAVGRSFEQEPRILTVHAEIGNKDGKLLPGMYINARIVTDSSSSLCIPNDGIIEKDGRSYIFKIKSKIEEEYTFERVEVIKGISDMGFTAIVGKDERIKPNDMVIISGAYYLGSEMAKGELEHHH